MKQRMYFLFPDAEQARAAGDDIMELDVAPEHIHTIARTDIDISGLPTATSPQRRDALAQIENGLWQGNLLLFALATVALVAVAVAGAVAWALVALLVMMASLAGGWFATCVPHTHLDEFSQALQRGEICYWWMCRATASRRSRF